MPVEPHLTPAAQADAALTWTPTRATHLARLERLADALPTSGLDAIVVSPGPDLAFLLGHRAASHERLTALVVTPEARHLVVPALEFPGWSTEVVDAAGIGVHTWRDGQDAAGLVADLLAQLPQSARVGVGDHLPAVHALALRDALAPRALVAGTGALAGVRARKDADEIAALVAVGAAIDRVQARMSEFLKPGRTENEVAADIAAAIVEEGHRRPDFVIVGSGPNGASPHHGSSNRVIAEGDVVVIDIGGPAPSGYNSDTTRTYIVGAASDPEAVRVHELVQAAQRAGFEAAVAGATCASVDAAARQVIEDAGYGEHFITRTGHGIGLEVHEHPYLVTGNDTPLAPGMAFSIEPGVYLPGRFGVRVEDIVVIDDAGRPRSLNQTPRGWAL